MRSLLVLCKTVYFLVYHSQYIINKHEIQILKNLNLKSKKYDHFQ